MRRINSLTAVALALAFARPPFAFAAPQQAPPPALPPEAAAIQKEYDDIVKYLGKKGSVGADDRKLIEQFIAKVRASPIKEDAMASAMVVQMGSYLEDWAAVDGAFDRILQLQPGNDTALAQWIASQNRRCQFQRAIELTGQHAQDMAKMPRSALAVAESLIGLNRFDEASSLLNQVSQAGGLRPDVAMQMKAVQTRAADLAAKWMQETGLRTAEEAKNDLPRIELVTNKGVVILELFEDQAPASTAALIGLVESGAYNGTEFHKRVPGMALLGGDPNTKEGAVGRVGFGTPGWRVVDEGLRSDHRVAFAGTFGLAKAMDPAKPGSTIANSAGQTLFFLLAPAEHLHDQYTIAGRVLDGFDVLLELTPSDEIAAAHVMRKRDHEYKNAPMPELATPMELTVPGPLASRPAPRPLPQGPAAPGAPSLTPGQPPRSPSSPPVVPAGTPFDPNNNPFSPTRPAKQ